MSKTWREKLADSGGLWCNQEIKLGTEPWPELGDAPGVQGELSVWCEGLSQEDTPRPIFAVTMQPREDGRSFMWLSGKQARELAAFLVEWADTMDEAGAEIRARKLAST